MSKFGRFFLGIVPVLIPAVQMDVDSTNIHLLRRNKDWDDAQEKLGTYTSLNNNDEYDDFDTDLELQPFESI